MRSHLTRLLEQSLQRLSDAGALRLPEKITISVERTRDSAHGDLASNIALLLAKTAGMKPRDLAQRIANNLPASAHLSKVEIAGPGFINFFLSERSGQAVIEAIHAAGDRYGSSDLGKGKKILVEFVSTNPTGPLHVGHGRGAAYGAAVANLLDASGYDVTREYYVNDAGRQMDILALSVWLRYLELCEVRVSFPENAYQGDYIREIAAGLRARSGADFMPDTPGLPAVITGIADPEDRLDAMIEYAKQRLGIVAYQTIHAAALADILRDIRTELESMNIHFDNWYSEQSLFDSGKVDACIERLRQGGELYLENGASWFRSTNYGDEKDRVVVRENGQKTYFASDIAYHLDKFARGFHRVIDVWGADHHGYIPRVKGALKALGENPESLEILLVQFAVLYRGSVKVQMSTRSGNYVTLRDLCAEIGKDAARFFYVTRRSEQHLDFDLELAKSQSNDNPVYYIQYAHARICSVLEQLRTRNLEYRPERALTNLALLRAEHELALLRTLPKYTEVVTAAAESREPHQLAFYLRDLATEFHGYYNSHQFLIEDVCLREARLALIIAVRQVIRNGLAILGVSAPEQM